jgi:hypothetical protein
MPRRNRNAHVMTIDPDELATGIRELASELIATARHTPVCAACWVNPATEGDYCLLCKGQLILSARKNATRR